MADRLRIVDWHERHFGINFTVPFIQKLLYLSEVKFSIIFLAYKLFHKLDMTLMQKSDLISTLIQQQGPI